jgi:hypothetical protein
MRTRLKAAVAVLILCAHGNATAQTTSARQPGTTALRQERSVAAPTFSPRLAGTWSSATDQIRLTGDFEESVWGKNASSVRTVQMAVRPSGEATLTVTRKVVDARGRTVAASTSIEEAQITLGGSQETIGGRVEHAVKVVSAERRYPDDPDYRWPLDGLKVQVVTFAEGDGNTIEVRVDTPEGRGSFWETLRRQGRTSTRRSSS